MRAQFEAHRSACASCSRYDRVIRQGVELYRACPGITPSEDFLPRLQHRLYHVDDEVRGPGGNGSGAQAALTLAIAATIAAVAWIPVARTPPTLAELPPVVARAPAAAAPAQPWPEPPFFSPADGTDRWNSAPPAGPAADLLFRHPSSSFHVHPVLQR